MRSFVIWPISSILSRHFITSQSKPKKLCITVIIKHILLSLIRHSWAGNNTQVIKTSDVYSAQGNRFFLRFPESFGRTGKICIMFCNKFFYIPLRPIFTRALSSPSSKCPSCGKEGSCKQKPISKALPIHGRSHNDNVYKMCPMFQICPFHII